MNIKDVKTEDFPVFWKWLRSQSETTQKTHIREVLNECEQDPFPLISKARKHPQCPKKAGLMQLMFFGRTLV